MTTSDRRFPLAHQFETAGHNSSLPSLALQVQSRIAGDGKRRFVALRADFAYQAGLAFS
jgi:hypothetical protein